MVGHAITHIAELAEMLKSALGKIDLLEKKLETLSFPHQVRKTVMFQCLIKSTSYSLVNSRNP